MNKYLKGDNMRQSQKILEVTDIYTYRRYAQQTLIMAGVSLFALFSGSALAATNAAGASCPADHMMYYLNPGNAAVTHPTSLVTTQPLTWTRNALSNSFTFSNNNVVFKLAFTEIIGITNTHPRYVAGIEATTQSINNAIIMQHESVNNAVNHKLTATINKPVSKFGFVTQDIDSNPDWNYNETLSLAYDGGALTSINTGYLVLSNNGRTVTGIDTDSRGRPLQKNCNRTNPCDIDVDWGSNTTPNTRFAPDTPFAVTHGNASSYPKTSAPYQTHIMGYSDFYFCMAPPTLTVKKALTGNRVNNVGSDRDQFEIKVTGGEIAANSFTTTGSNAEITTGTSALLNLKQGTTYTITEQVKNGSAVGAIANYDASYTCSNATTSSNTAISTTAMQYNATAKTRSFTLSGVNYGDDITCTITNTPKNYTFSGTVFNDNGGLSGKTSEDKNGTFISNTKYFNGKLDTGESGISGITYPDLKVSLTNCAGTNIGNTTAQTVSSTGQYSFTVPSSALNGINEVCMVQTKSNAWDYTVNTTPIKLPKTLENNVYNYDNLNFGKVTTEQTALVLKKYQYVHQCDANLIYTASTINGADIGSPNNGFSMNPADKVDPGQCIAYKIEAYNHGHIALTDIRITDPLQKTPIESRFHLPVAAGIAATLRKTYEPTSPLINIGDNGAIITAPFALNNNAATTSVSKATLYFNTKYGTSVGGI